tara:strand:+ start:555 stop:1013 length:459 start_codon:yes stop_codon:yes gene_type:complete
MNKIIIFIIINLIVFFSLLYISYIHHVYTLKKKGKKKVTLSHYLNRGKIPSFKNIVIGLTFGLIFGFLDNLGLWMGIDVFYKYIPGGTLTKAGWGNTYSDLLGATVGTFIAEIAKDYFDYDDNNQPIWLNSLGIFLGCVLGMTVGKLLTKRN